MYSFKQGLIPSLLSFSPSYPSVSRKNKNKKLPASPVNKECYLPSSHQPEQPLLMVHPEGNSGWRKTESWP